MLVLVIGLLLFLGVHSVRIVADPWRTRMRTRLGENGWKGLYTLVSLVGFALIVWGFGLARAQPVVLWPAPPVWVKHFAALLTLVAFVLLVAAYVPGNAIKARLHHPMMLGTKLWAFAHLISNNTLADVLLFGSFLAWSVLGYSAARRRDRAARTVYAAGRTGPTLVAVLVGVLAWAAFAFWAHGAWIGVRPFG